MGGALVSVTQKVAAETHSNNTNFKLYSPASHHVSTETLFCSLYLLSLFLVESLFTIHAVSLIRHNHCIFLINNNIKKEKEREKENFSFCCYYIFFFKRIVFLYIIDNEDVRTAFLILLMLVHFFYGIYFVVRVVDKRKAIDDSRAFFIGKIYSP